MMEQDKLVHLFKATLDPNQRQEAEKQLEQIQKIIGFVPTLLQMVMNGSIEMPVRQAIAVYLKNCILGQWETRQPEPAPGMPPPPLEFSIHEQDRAMIRDSIVEGMVLAPDLLKVHLAVCVNHIVKHDFPDKWSSIVDKIAIYLQNPDPTPWMGALIALHQLAKNYEFKTSDDRRPLIDAMRLLLPLMYQRISQIVQDDSEAAVLLQKQMLKVFYTLTQYNLPLSLFTNEVFTQWMEVIRVILEKPVPDKTLEVDEEERPELPWWKVKKWALHILTRVFERYGLPNSVQKEYKQFADFYIKTFSGGVIQALLKILEQVGNKKYVAPRVLQQALNYMNTAVGNNFTWKMIRGHMKLIIENILFPLLCITDEDEDLWTSDPVEYIRVKFDVFEDYISPKVAAQTLLHTACKKRKGILPNSVTFAFGILMNSASTPRHIDGALHLIGAVADLLLKKEEYKNQIENMLVAYIFPHFASQHGYLRARACWVLHYFSDTRFQNEAHLIQAFEHVLRCLLKDQELPVKVEAALCLQVLISEQEKVQKMMEQHCRDVTIEILKIIRETENEDLTNVMQKMVYVYSEQLMPIAVEITQHLAQTFNHVANINNDVDDDNEDRGLAAMGILNTLDSVLTMMEDNKEIMAKLEPIVLELVVNILNRDMLELYEEAMTLLTTLSLNVVSEDMWKMLELLYSVFKKEGVDYFTDMMPTLHNYVTVDPEGLLANGNRFAAIFDMCRGILTNDEAGEDAQAHAAKLLEVMILQFKGQEGFLQQAIPPFVELVMSRMTREVKTDELKTQCMIVMIAAFYSNPHLFFETLNKLQPPNAPRSLIDTFIKQWIDDTDMFLGLHDRKVNVLGLTTLIKLPPQLRPPILNEMANQVVPSCLLLFEKLKLAYQAKAAADNESDDDDDDEEYESDDEVDQQSDGDDEAFEQDEDASDEDDDDDEDYEDDGELTTIESYTTTLDDDDCPVDEYQEFKNTLESVRMQDPNWFNILMASIDQHHQKNLQEISTLAQQRKDAYESRKIEKGGGYVFDPNRPPQIDFGGSPPAPISS